MSANLNGDISMCMSAEVLNGRILRAIEVVRSTLKGLPEGEGGVSTFQLVTVLTDVEEALLGMSDAPDPSKSGSIGPPQAPPPPGPTHPHPSPEAAPPEVWVPTLARGFHDGPAAECSPHQGPRIRKASLPSSLWSPSLPAALPNR